MDEAMRMCPPVPGLLPREVLPGGINVDGHYIPESTEIGTPTYAIHHEPIYFPAPLSFQPEQRLTEPIVSGVTESSKEEVALAWSAFCAFSKGPRDCVAKQMAYRETMIVLASILWGFEMKVVARRGRTGSWLWPRKEGWVPTASQLRDLDWNLVSSWDDVISYNLILPISRSSNDLLLTSQMAERGGSENPVRY